MKRFFLLFLLVFFTTLTCIGKDVKIDGIYYRLNSETKTATVVGEFEDRSTYSGNIIIADEVTYREKGLTTKYKVTAIGMYAFRGCKDITSVAVGNYVTSIGYKRFDGCSNLTTVTIGNSVTKIEDCAFAGCSSLASVTIPSGVTSIGNSAFYGCMCLTSISIPNNVTEIGRMAFYLCTKLANITIPNRVTSIEENTFGYCRSLASVVIGESVKTIADDAFSETNIKKTIWLTDKEPWGAQYAKGKWINFVKNEQIGVYYKRVIYPLLSLYFDVDGIRYVPISPTDETCDAIDCVYDEKASTISVPSSVTYMGKDMTVKNIQQFFGYGNNYIINLSVNNNGGLSNDAFGYCSNLQNLTIGKNVNFIGNKAFYSCNNLKSVNVSDISSWCNIQFGDNDDDSEANPLYYARRLYLNGAEINNLEIPNNITKINNYTFYNCTSLASVSIPDNVTSIGEKAFYRCENLLSVTIGSGAESISESSFGECTELKEIFCYAKNVPQTSIDAFNDTYINHVILHVPENSVNAYTNTEPWKDFYTIESIKPKYSLIYIINRDIYKIYHVEENKIVIPEPNPIRRGCTFSGWSSIPKTMPANNVEITGSFNMRGDVNRDNKVDDMDINEIVLYILGTPSSLFDAEAANVNNDNVVNISDIVAIINNSLNDDSDGKPDAVCLEVSSTSQSFESIGNSNKLFITCNDSWTVSSDQSWCTITPVSGTDNGSLTIAVAENPNTLFRCATLTVEAGLKIKTVIVIQDGADKTPNDIVAVDLGLPSGTLWSNMNVGASRPEEYGYYYAWGEVFPKSHYAWETYKHCEGSEKQITKYCTKSEYGFCDKKRVLDSCDDAATVNWGSNWHMPSVKQYEELINNTNYEWTNQNGINGWRFMSKTNDNSIFLPAAGYHYDSDIIPGIAEGHSYSVGMDGYYWSSELHVGKPNCAWNLGFSNKKVFNSVSSDRNKGKPVRPVRNK